MKIYRYSILVIFLGLISAEDTSDSSPTFSDFQISSERYMTDESGNVMMYVNIESVCILNNWLARATLDVIFHSSHI